MFFSVFHFFRHHAKGAVCVDSQFFGKAGAISEYVNGSRLLGAFLNLKMRPHSHKQRESLAKFHNFKRKVLQIQILRICSCFAKF